MKIIPRVSEETSRQWRWIWHIVDTMWCERESV